MINAIGNMNIYFGDFDDEDDEYSDYSMKVLFGHYLVTEVADTHHKLQKDREAV